MSENQNKPTDAKKNGSKPATAGTFLAEITAEELDTIMREWLAANYQIKASSLNDFAKSNKKLALVFEVERQ